MTWQKMKTDLLWDYCFILMWSSYNLSQENIASGVFLLNLLAHASSLTKELTMSTKPTPADARLHLPKLVLSRHVHKEVHGDSLIGRINTRLAVGITKIVGSMWCAYAFALLALVSLPAAI